MALAKFATLADVCGAVLLTESNATIRSNIPLAAADKSLLPTLPNFDMLFARVSNLRESMLATLCIAAPRLDMPVATCSRPLVFWMPPIAIDSLSREATNLSMLADADVASAIIFSSRESISAILALSLKEWHPLYSTGAVSCFFLASKRVFRAIRSAKSALTCVSFSSCVSSCSSTVFSNSSCGLSG